MVFEFVPLKQNDQNDAFLLINKPAAAQAVRNHPADFDAAAKSDIVKWIKENIAEKLKKPEPWKEELPVLQDGLCGFQEIGYEYPRFDACGKISEFAHIYSGYVFHGINVYEVLEVLDSLKMPKRTGLICSISCSAPCPDRLLFPGPVS